MSNMEKKIIIVGAGVAGVNAATKLVDKGYPGELITIIDMGKDPYNRKPEEVMTGFLGAGGWSDGKLTYHTAIGGQLSKYCGEEKAMELMDQVITNFKRFHPKSVQIGVRFEAPQEHFQKLIDISYDFKLYRKFEDKGVSLRSFCTNNNAAYVAVEETYGDHTYNGHAKKDMRYRNDMTNFGILMEINGIEDPFTWSRDVVNKLQFNGTGLYYSPTRVPSTTAEGNNVTAFQIDNLSGVENVMGEYWTYIMDFIEDMKKVFPTLQDDWGIYIPEVKYLSPEPLVSYRNLSLTKFPNVHFVGDALSARGITVSGAQAIYVAEDILSYYLRDTEYPEFISHYVA
jgi:uncharacterized FAD-dependent dehydrogenase